jgi:uncharacterized protein (DUF697 family)
MSNHILRQIRTAFRQLNPNEVRRAAGRPLSIALVAASSQSMAAMEDLLAPPTVSRKKRAEIFELLHRVGDPGAPLRYDLEIVEESLLAAPGAFLFYEAEPERMVREILDQREDLQLALARHFPAFRKAVVARTIQEVSRENALFALLTALPDVLPGLFVAGWAAGEFASDTAVLTVNQVRMAFVIAAASDRELGYREQKAQIASIVAAAFGWRALARELVGKIPFGGGLIPKAAVAYAGTFVVGESLQRFYDIGYGYTRAERQFAYQQAFERGKDVAKSLMESIRRRPERKGDIPSRNQ